MPNQIALDTDGLSVIGYIQTMMEVNPKMGRATGPETSIPIPFGVSLGCESGVEVRTKYGVPITKLPGLGGRSTKLGTLKIPALTTALIT